MIRALFLGFCLATFLCAQTAAQTREVDLQPSDGWVDTNIALNPGDTFEVTATGQLQYTGAKTPNGPDGLARGFADLIKAFPVNAAGRGAVIGRIGDNAAARAFLIGANYSSQAPVAGHLFVAVNQSSMDEASGSYHLTLRRTAATKSAAANLTVLPFPQSQLDSIPRRVTDPNGAPGDRVNFIVIGSEDQMKAALKAAGWVVVDRTQQEAVVSGLLASLSKQAYVTLPMSELVLYGRPQDFGYAQADPLQVITSRHHFRIWKAPFDLDGQTVWVGAGTHDIGFDRDQRNNGITHKIDPNTDAERDYIRDSLVQTGMTAKTTYMTPANPVTKAHT
ncbi:MAG: LssY C-terminal domain-containing protein, partial [Silvibacterium sp.]|nr:LssY C-terminal domain-containing protein [Silvibacterium sp.]